MTTHSRAIIPELPRHRAIELGLIQPGAGGALGKLRRPRAQPEHQEQVKLFAWVDGEGANRWPVLAWSYAVPNYHFDKSPKRGAYLKAEGKRAGVPDVVVPVMRGGFGSLYIEMKTPGNRPTTEQAEYHKVLRALGHRVQVCYSAAEAIGEIIHYMLLPSSPSRI